MTWFLLVIWLDMINTDKHTHDTHRTHNNRYTYTHISINIDTHTRTPHKEKDNFRKVS